jgi:predicted O-methyltransferase YrrM
MNIQKETVDNILAKIETEITSGQYQLPLRLMQKLESDNELARLNLSYINGQGGYYYQLLPLLVRYLQPRKILELGSSYGVSALMMYSELAEQSELVTLDIEKDIRFLPDEVLQDSRFRFVLGDDLDLNIFAGEVPYGIDLMYIDTFHFAQQVRDEFDVYKYLLADTALVVLDDIHYKDTGDLFFESNFPKWDVTELYHKSGFGILLFQRPKDFPADERGAVLQAALASARIGHRKFHNLENELRETSLRQVYGMAQKWASQHPISATVLRRLVRPFKKIIIPKEKIY